MTTTSNRVGEFATGEWARVHRPAWKDATGRAYEAGEFHGRVGRLVFTDGPRVGSDYICDIDVDGRVVTVWASELRRPI